MGSLLVEGPVVEDLRVKQDEALLHRLGCEACPLSGYAGRMLATGAEHPTVYVLGEAPGEDEIKKGRQFVGASGELLRPRIPDEWQSRVRWNNVVRSRPPKNRTPVWREIEACRPSVEQDIAASKPEAIFGFGNVPLHWISGYNGITLWRGRRMPVKVLDHVAWYYAMVHPSFILRDHFRKDVEFPAIGSEDERMFVLDIKKALHELDAGLPPPVVHDEAMAREGVALLTRFGREGLNEIASWLSAAAGQPAVGLDWETRGLRPYEANAKLLTAALSWGEKTFAFGIEHPQAMWTPAELAELIEMLGRWLERSACTKVVHSLAFEQEWTQAKIKPGILRASRWEDTASAAAILDERKGERKPGCFSLEFLCQQYFGFDLKGLSKVDRNRLGSVSLPKVLAYNALDAKYHLLLWGEQKRDLVAQDLWEPYELARRRVPTVVYTQAKGVPVDQAEVAVLSKKYGDRITTLEEEVAHHKIVTKFVQLRGRPFNPMSNPDALFLFHDMLNRAECEITDKYTKQIRLSVDENVMDIIAKEEPLAEHILTLRKAHKRKSTYIDVLSADPAHVEITTLFPDGLLHPQFNTIFAETGRLSCEFPNMQNFPKREDEAKEVRRQIKAPLGCVILAFDYGQIEARVIAMFTKDKRFCKALWERYDVHMEWAERIATEYPRRIGGKAMLKDKKAMKDFRTDIKNQWTFPLFFGASPRSASLYLGIPEEVIYPLYDEFWDQFSGVLDWQKRQLKLYQQLGYVECLTGRRRRGPFSVNQVYNTPVQGTAAEIVMDAMCRLSEAEVDELQPEINIHDDLTYVSVPTNRVDEIAERVIDTMLDVPFSWVNVPITVEMAIGPNWMDVKELDGGSTFSSDTWQWLTPHS